MRQYLLGILFIFSATAMFGQDPIFTQFWATPQSVNPAYTAFSEEDYFGYVKHRRQWGSISDVFVTSAAGGSYALKRRRNNPTYLGVGLDVAQDQAGSGNLTRLNAMGNAAIHLTANRNNRFSSGITLGYFQRSINFSDLLWDSQFNGVGADPSIPSGENITENNVGFVDAGLGVLWEHKKKHHYQIGISGKHFFQNQSLVNSNEGMWLPLAQLQLAYFKSYKRFDLDFHGLVLRQGGAMQYKIASLVKYRFGADSRYTDAKTSSLLIAGASYRYGDAISPILGFEFQRMITAYVSYDLNVSSLQEYTNLQGALEFSIVYKGSLLKTRRRLR
ncbi:MAG: PorP/SprF family type IX secretion system membrane protein [Flavobacteriales bacterium]|nr:PorP/SprF family type IX secretion system membrane protein [Flavobacteriales bacterium]